MKVYVARSKAPYRLWYAADVRGRRYQFLDRSYDGLIAQIARELPDAQVELLHRNMSDKELWAAVDEAMWEGDIELLCELAPCRCCCWEHTFESCPARRWNGCRGSGSMTAADLESWVRHYADHHGMTRDQFFGGP